MRRNTTKKLIAIFVADPLESFNPEAETTFYLIREAERRNFTAFVTEPGKLALRNNQVTARVREISLKNTKPPFVAESGIGQEFDLSKADVIFLRKDPPVDLYYLDHLNILEFLRGKTLLINDPAGIRAAPEKISPQWFDGIFAQTLISADQKTLRDFVIQHKRAVLKPLNLSGGRGVIIARHDDPSLGSLIELQTQSGKNFIVAQEFLPAAIDGDKRILLHDGEILGAFLRVPGKNDFRGNLHSGAKLTACKITAREQKIVARLTPTLRELGLYFVGIDLLGDVVTEINVTSPMGIGEINQLTGNRCEERVWDWINEKI